MPLLFYKQRLKDAQHLKPNAKRYRENTIGALLKSWPNLEKMDIRKIAENDCLQWASGFAKKYAASFFNNTVGTVRQAIQIAIESGARFGNPAMKIKKLKVRQKILKLPEHDQFPALVQTVRKGGSRFNKDCGDLIEFLAYSGARKSEAARVMGEDCDFANGKITIKGDPETGTKNWEIRHIPMISDMRQLLERIRSQKTDKQWLNNPVIGVRECQKSIDSACKKLEIARFTHHDLRHLFATRCIESGVDIPTVSRWLGHKDGGALAMKTYGHLRDQHSTTMAQKVNFSATAPNVIPLSSAVVVQNGSTSQDVPASMDKKAVAQAKAKYSFPWWVSKNPMEVFWGQLNEETQIVPLEKFLDCAKQAMSREVFVEEFDDGDSLKEEFVERISKAAFVELANKIQRKQADAVFAAS